jgi:hypothetical protein
VISLFGPQNQAGYGLSVASQNRWEDEDSAGHALRSSGLLCLESSQAWVSQSGLKTGAGVARMVHVASLQRSRGSEAKECMVRWHRVRRCGSRTKLPIISFKFPFGP